MKENEDQKIDKTADDVVTDSSAENGNSLRNDGDPQKKKKKRILTYCAWGARKMKREDES